MAPYVTTRDSDAPDVAKPLGTEPDRLDLERAIDTRETARITGLNEITLQQHRARGGGPRWFRAGTRAIRYRLGDVIAWRDARMVGKAQ